MSWFTLSIISVITLAISNLLRRVLMKDDKSDAVAYSLVFQLMCAFLVGLFAFSHGFVALPVFELPLNFLLTMVLYGTGTLLLFRAVQTTEASKATILASSSTLWAVIVALILLGESFSVLKIIGVGLILGGIILISLKKEVFSLSRGDLYVLCSALCYGIAFANDTFILRQSDVLSYTALAFLLPGLFILAIQPKALRKLGSFSNLGVLLRMAIMSIFYSASAVTVYLAYQKGGAASQLAPIGQSVVILTVLLAAIFLGERENLGKKFVAAIMTTIGVLLLK
ncbi:MAG: DMT family transporter [Candidatus Colwellbacteria bacterium]|nr:DMT family transporter [Candidatus Colwellbacteria bacterium]